MEPGGPVMVARRGLQCACHENGSKPANFPPGIFGIWALTPRPLDPRTTPFVRRFCCRRVAVCGDAPHGGASVEPACVAWKGPATLLPAGGVPNINPPPSTDT